MARILFVLALLAPLSVPAPSLAQELAAPADSMAPLRSFRAITGMMAGLGGRQEYELVFLFGWLRNHGERGGWVTRIDAGGGLSLHGANDAGYLVGAQAGLARVWTGDYLSLTPEVPIELYGVVSGGAYYAWSLKEAPREEGVVPVVAVGGGLRFPRVTATGETMTFEVIREERLGRWTPRTFLRLSYGLPIR